MADLNMVEVSLILLTQLRLDLVQLWVLSVVHLKLFPILLLVKNYPVSLVVTHSLIS